MILQQISSPVVHALERTGKLKIVRKISQNQWEIQPIISRIELTEAMAATELQLTQEKEELLYAHFYFLNRPY